jgi:rhamnosyl/mannosyltransferase
MKVLHLGKYYPPVHGGIETHLRLLAHGLRHRGVEVEVVVANVGATRSEETDDGIRVVRLPRYFDVSNAPVYSGVSECIRKAHPDLVHLHFPNPWGVVAYLRSGHRGPLIITYHSDIIGRRILQIPFSRFLYSLLDRADLILATSPNYISSSPVLSRYERKCRVIPLGISGSQFESVDENEVRAIRSRFKQPIVLAVGRLVRYKGFEYLIRSMQNVDAQLVIIGDGKLQDELEKEILRCGLKDRAVILPYIQDIRPYYHAADVFVLSSVTRAEAFGIVQMEAMASAKPVINTSLLTGVPFVSLDGVTGFTVVPGDAGSLSQAINRILADRELRDRFGAAGKERVRTMFDAEQMITNILACYS